MNPPTREEIEAAGFPDELKPFIEEGTLAFGHVDKNCTLIFNIPKKEETRTEVWLHWHPEDPATWDYEESRWYIRVEHYHDRGHNSAAGMELVEFGRDVSDLVDWLESED